MKDQEISDNKDEFIIGVLSNISEEELREAKTVSDKCHEEETYERDDGTMIAYDDVSGSKLKPEMVKKARKEEIEYIKKLGVYRKVPISKCLQQTGKKPIQVRWIDVNKGDEKNPVYRSRLVAKDFKTSINLEWYAATPPLETLRTLVSMGATTAFGEEGPNKNHDK